MKRACVLLADGFEETEAVAVVDVLRRADIKVDVLGVEAKKVTGSHDIVVKADALLSDRRGEKYDLVVHPGANTSRRDTTSASESSTRWRSVRARVRCKRSSKASAPRARSRTSPCCC